MSGFFCNSPRLQLLERQMRQPPGYRPRGQGWMFDMEEWKSRGNYSEIVDCVISRMQMEHLKKRIQEVFGNAEKELIFYDSRHRNDFSSLLLGRRKKNLCGLPNYAAAVFLLSADENLWEKVSKQVLDTGIYFDRIRLGSVTLEQYILFHAARDVYLGTKHIRLSELTDRELIPDEILRLIVNAFVMERYGVDIVEREVWHIHVKGSCSDGRSFRLNQEGSEAAYGFGYRGTGNRLYVFEAPIDLLSFLSLYPDNWQENSYITLNGVAEHAMLQALKDNPRLDTVVLCLDHDPAGIEACGRLAEILVRNGYGAVKRLQSACKDWNEDLKGRYGEETIPAQEHPRVMECRAWTEVLKEVTESINIKYANRSYICRYYQDIYNELKKGRGREQLMDAFDGPGMLLTGVLVRCMEKEGIALGRETSAGQILENLSKRYQPHKDKGNFNTRIRQMQAAFEETLEVFDTKDLEQKENQELLARKCMSFAMECIRAHIFVAIDCGEEQMKPAKQNVKEQKVEHQEGGMMLCSQS